MIIDPVHVFATLDRLQCRPERYRNRAVVIFVTFKTMLPVYIN